MKFNENLRVGTCPYIKFSDIGTHIRKLLITEIVPLKVGNPFALRVKRKM